ncbi:BQ5605_C015g07897 [Microbotryum silenes-dioicae]|uniref:BQ5605_C015g07897 protein n=1 Tax=Microbotryum silenes-dioicae TaxID=796604 RepID=A0A2X0LXS5_9BASI|nr:BQ5605_C015g07897 [Microbotryum silenes-dioicae]
MTRKRRRYNSTTRQDRRRQADLFARFRLHKLSLCQYLSWYFSPSTQHDGVHTNRPKLFNGNWTQLKHVLDLIMQLAREDGPDARGRINNWIATFQHIRSGYKTAARPLKHLHPTCAI